MKQSLKQKDSPIHEAIKAVGIGKKGSRDLSSEQIAQLLSQLKEEKVSEAALGAFLGALFIKGSTDEELQLETFLGKGSLKSSEKLISSIANGLPENLKNICTHLLNGKHLNIPQAEKLGAFLFSDQEGDILRGLAASIMRVRYETIDEYEGLLSSITKTFSPLFQTGVPPGNPIIQMAEPFDGVNRSYMITPLIANALQALGFRVICLAGKSSGPKFGNNLYDLARHLKCQFIKSNNEITDQSPDFGYYLDQADLSEPLNRWVGIRKHMIKRPFLATLEKFVNPAKADILMASAFHAPYGEKMLAIAQRAGFNNIIIVRNGMEGSLAFALKRSAKILCSHKAADGTFIDNEIMLDPSGFIDMEIKVEEKIAQPKLEKNVNLIQTYKTRGKTGYPLFDNRVRITLEGIKQALNWINR